MSWHLIHKGTVKGTYNGQYTGLDSFPSKELAAKYLAEQGFDHLYAIESHAPTRSIEVVRVVQAKRLDPQGMAVEGS